MALDGAGNLYIADTGNNRIRLVTPAGSISTVAGNGLPGSTGDGGLARDAQLGSPAGVAVDGAGSLYVADGAARVRKVYASGFINTIAGTAVRGYAGDGGPAAGAMLNGPSAVALDATGNVYIADTGNQAARELQFGGFGLTASAVTNGASNLAGAIAPGEIVVLYGAGLGPATLAQAALNASGVLGTTLAGTSVFINSAAAPVLYTSSNQVAAIVPYGVTGNRAQVSVQYQGQVSTPSRSTWQARRPGAVHLEWGRQRSVLAVNANRLD